MNGGWTIAIMVGPVVGAVLFCVFVAFTILMIWSRDGDEFLAFCSGVLAVGAIGFTVFGCFPFTKEYHYWTPKEGTVAAVSSRILSNGDSVNQKFVLQFEDNPQPYGVNDTRAALVKVGDHVRILCKRSHQWGPSADGYDCRWGQQ